MRPYSGNKDNRCVIAYTFTFLNLKCSSKAVIIVVYTYGLVTLMARNVEEAASCEFLEVIVNYFPVIPSMQVITEILHKQNYLLSKVSIRSKEKYLLFSVFHFSYLAKFRSSSRKSLWS